MRAYLILGSMIALPLGVALACGGDDGASTCDNTACNTACVNAGSASGACSSGACSCFGVRVGDPCWDSDLSGQSCTGGSMALYCAYNPRIGGGVWTSRNCDAECRNYGYTGGSCGAGTWGRAECICSGVTYSSWTVGGGCTYEGDSYCVSRGTMYYCQGGAIYSYDCMSFCMSYLGYAPADAFCMYDPSRAWPGGYTYPDDNCYCKTW